MRAPPLSTPAELRIGRWTLRAPIDELELDGQRVKLEPRLTQLLLALCERAGEVVDAASLHDSVWGRLQVTPNSIYEAVGQLRRVLAADRSTPAYIATVPRRGYRLLAPVVAAAPASHGRLRLVVLPFRSRGLGPALAPLRERLLEGLIGGLSRHPACTVMARGSALALADGRDPAGQAARLFGADFIVDGHIAHRGSGLSIGAELVDARSRDLLWTGANESPPLDGPELATPMVEQLARSLDLQLTAAAARHPRSGLGPARRLAIGAWVELFCRPQNETTNQRAWSLAGRAVDADADDALALVARAWAGFRAANFGWQGLPRAETLAAAGADAQRALVRQPDLHDAHYVHGILVQAGGEFACAEAALRHGVRLMPALAPAWGDLAWLAICQGRPQEAAGLCDHAFAISPCEPHRANWHWHLARAALDLDEPERALQAAQHAIAANPELPGGYLCGLAAAQQLGRSELVAAWLPWVAARPRYATVRSIGSHYNASSPANLRHRELLMRTLGAAGLPAG